MGISSKSRSGVAGSVGRYLSASLALLGSGGCGSGDAAAPDPEVAVARTDGSGGAAERRPHVVFVVLDTARADHFHCYGYERETSPHLDRLAEESVLYLHAQSPAPWTLPAHASLFTGLYPLQHGMHRGLLRSAGAAGGGSRTPTVPEPGKILAKRFRDAGYTTLGFSNNPWVARDSGLDAGFDIFVEFWNHSRDVAQELRDDPPWGLPQELRAVVAARTVALCKKIFHQDGVEQPFFLFFNFTDAHFPYTPVPGFRGTFGSDPELIERMKDREAQLERKLLAGAITMDGEALARAYDEELLQLDAAVGHLVEWLRQSGCYDDTLLVVTSDHGEHLGENGRYSHQLSVAAELLHVPLIVKFPHGEHGGTVVEQPVSTLDLYPTLLNSAGIGDSDLVSGELGESGIRGPRPLPVSSTHASDDQAAFLSEYFNAPSWLNSLQKLNPEFDVAAHSAVRRVVQEADRRIEYRDAEIVDVRDRRGVAQDAEPPLAVSLDQLERHARQNPNYASRPLGDDERRLLVQMGYLDADE